MDEQLRSRLIEILVDRGLIGLLIVLFGWQVNGSLERYKLVEAERVSDTSQFVKACSELWAKAYDYEQLVGQSVELRTRQWLLSAIKGNDGSLKAEIAQKEKLMTSRLVEFSEALAERRYIVGEPMTAHFSRYIALVLTRAHAENDAGRGIGEYERKISQDAIEDIDRQLASMRFSATAAREHAISTIP